MEQNTQECIFEGMGLEYDQLYCKYQVDSLVAKDSVDHSMQLEFYVCLLFKYLYYEPTCRRDIHIVATKKEALIKLRN